MWIDTTTYQDTGIARSTGWRQFGWDATSGNKVDVYIDGVKVATDTSHSNFNRITLGWWTVDNSTTSVFDDVLISDSLP